MDTAKLKRRAQGAQMLAALREQYTIAELHELTCDFANSMRLAKDIGDKEMAKVYGVAGACIAIVTDQLEDT